MEPPFFCQDTVTNIFKNFEMFLSNQDGRIYSGCREGVTGAGGVAGRGKRWGQKCLEMRAPHSGFSHSAQEFTGQTLYVGFLSFSKGLYGVV